jgi:four helix bundle protein
MSDSILRNKSYSFALNIIQVYKWITEAQKEFVLSKQLLRAGTSIGASIREAEFAQSKPDFISKMSIALKEANETEYWISLLHDSNFINNELAIKLIDQNKELINMLVSTIKTTKSNLKH